jgi:hypothetical protein
MLIQSRNVYDDGFAGLDPNFTSPEAIASLIVLEGQRLPHTILEPASGDGAIVRPLRESGRLVIGNDVYPYEGRPGDTVIRCSLTLPLIKTVRADGMEHVIAGAVTNPPFSRALDFARRLLPEFRYVALLVRSNFYVEAASRDAFFELYPPTRVYFFSLRAPMMHRYQWAGPRKSSNTAHCWLVWERDAEREFPRRFNWRKVLGGK